MAILLDARFIEWPQMTHIKSYQNAMNSGMVYRSGLSFSPPGFICVHLRHLPSLAMISGLAPTGYPGEVAVEVDGGIEVLPLGEQRINAGLRDRILRDI